MKNLVKIIFLGIFMCTLVAFAGIPMISPLFTPKVSTITPVTKPIIEIKAEPIKVELPEFKSHSMFLKAIGHMESGNRYHIVNRYGYMGRYQFGNSTLKSLGIKVSRDEFLQDHDLQELAMSKLLESNKRSLKRFIEKYEGKVVHGIYVTESGLLAAAHLGGPGSVRKWFRTGKIRQDGNGTKITTYMIKFSGYKLDL